MVSRTGMSQVKFKVRYNALLLREFTVADMVRATGQNPESVRTELQRMKQEGLLTSQPHEEKPKKRGGRPALYRLTDDPEARLALSQSIEAFYPPPPAAERPTSRHYLSAQKLLDQAQAAEDPKSERLLSDAERDLEMAEQAEGSSLAPQSVKAYLQYERARLAYLRGNCEEAEESFEALRGFFTDFDDEVIVRRIDEFRLCLEAWRRFAAGRPGSVGEAAWARCLLDTLADNAYQTDSPLILRLLQSLWQLSRTTEERIHAAAYDRTVELTREVRVEIDALRSNLERLPREIGIVWQRDQRQMLRLWQTDEPPPQRFDDWDLSHMLLWGSRGSKTDD